MAVYTMRAAIGGGSRSMIPLLLFVDYVIHLYEYVIIAAVIFSWLVAFNVINASNPFVRTVWHALGAVTEPLLRPIRRYMPDLGGLDISPVVLLLACFFVRFVVIRGWFIEGALRG
jgi:YggT family protein